MEKKAKKIPLRQCLGCNGHFPKKELLRVVRDPAGAVSLDFTGKKSGRGAYICKSSACLVKAEKTGRLARNLECEIPAEVYTAMREELAAHEAD
ncbi:MAG: YlxR family protein [Clostridia bacterium]|nr:YlxR family protein [Clostridia bacterium]